MEQQGEVVSVLLSLDDLDLQKKCEVLHEFEYLKNGVTPTGVFFSIIGDHAPEIREFSRKSINKIRRDEQMAKKRGKEMDRGVEDDEQFGIDITARKIKKWRGIKEECTLATAIRLCTINVEIRRQVAAASEDLTNFS